MDSRLIEPGCQVRLIVDGPGLGCRNMAVDEVLLETAAAGIPTLRFYQWQEPTLSLGYFQSLEDRELHPASRHCPVVRRSSGGGAIVHDHELTYSFSCPVLGIDTQQFYREMHHALRFALAQFHIRAELWQADQGSIQGTPFLCFQRRSPGDMVVQNVKIAGSAQRRKRGALLQHGSVLLGTSRHAPELSSIGSELGIELQFDELVGQWCQIITEQWGIKFQESELGASEIERAEGFESEKFANIDWTRRQIRS